MAKVRVSTLAKEFGMTSKELMGHLAEMKIPAKSASSALEDAYVAMVRKQLASVIEARAKEVEAAKQAEEEARRQAEEEARKAEEARLKAEAQEIAGKLENCPVKISAKAGNGGKLFGAVTNKEISEGLKAQYGVDIPKQKIVLDEPIKAYGSYQVKAKLGFEISGTVNVLVIEEK